MTTLFPDDLFADRHIGPKGQDLTTLLDRIGVGSLDELTQLTVPAAILRNRPLATGDALTERELLDELHQIAYKNKILSNFIGGGYYGTVTPPVIRRNVTENPGWYTAYTPYQAEIAQGRLEALFNFQTVIAELTGLPIANASLLDEATAAAEAMTLAYRSGNGARRFFVSTRCFSQTIEVIRLRAEPLHIEVEVGDVDEFVPSTDYFGVLIQYPAHDGTITDFKQLVSDAHAHRIQVTVAADILSLTLLVPPGEWGADIVVGSTQRLGVPMGYGGPHAAFFATKDEFKRQIPGRIIGASVDRLGNPAFRMALQTREQHIRREKATSNICTAQALLAIMASFYSIYHGPDGLKRIATRIHQLAHWAARSIGSLGFSIASASYFDTVSVTVASATQLSEEAIKRGINIRIIDATTVAFSVDETHSVHDLEQLVSVFEAVSGQSLAPHPSYEIGIPTHLLRRSAFMQQPVFNRYHSETQLMRYIKQLETKDLALNTAMIPLGSCTMKLNAAAEMIPITWRNFSQLHPFVPVNQAEGYRIIFDRLSDALCESTGFAACSLQPNSGAQGEYAGLMVIRAYHHYRGDAHRTIALIPSSAHGTNPASAALAGLEIVIVSCDDQGNIDVDDLRAKAIQYSDRLSVLMVTYPSTHGVFESEIQTICEIIHQNGGQVYMDGANMNAQVGLTSPALIGADVCHINLHKTFSIPHGGGGPGMGPICVAAHLEPFLPGHPFVDLGHSHATRPVSAAPWGSASILIISYAYIRMMGGAGLTRATQVAIANANYIKERLAPHYDVLYVGQNGRVAHELILNFQPFKKQGKIEVEDIAKRLIDYGFHAPTVSFPVAGTLMIEPTESENVDELDRFCDAMISIRSEIDAIIEGSADATHNVLKNAPHTAAEAIATDWGHPYSRETAVYPPGVNRSTKFWPSVARIDGAYGDRNLVCTCAPIETYVTA